TLLCLWDDHESANNPWMHGAKNHNPDEGEGEWALRRAASLQAYYEWMPIREPAPGLSRAEFWRSYVFGDLATLVTLETRHLARAKQLDEKDYAASINSQADADKFKAEVLNEPGRKMISDKMEAFLTDAMKTSKAAGQPWRLIGNATPIARIGVPDMEKLGVLKLASPEQMQSDAAKKIIWQGKYNMPYYTDSWDGYPWAREKLYAAGRSVGVHDMLFLTGDSHSFWMNRLFDDAGDAVGLELGTAGVTSPGDFVGNGWDLETAIKLDKVFGDEVNEVVWTDNFNQGYVRVELFPNEAKVSFMAVSTVLKPSYTIRVLKETVIKHKGNSIVYTKS
ncbi:MAG: alkaline phosphatase D family protein, partial [Robiginitomaculum sp.]|nr:alkaline phosphatase D family protein [Robiginitomaculum sp.]